VSRLPDGAMVIDGAATIRDLREQAGLPLEVSPEYQTVAGFLLHTLHAVPQPGAAVTAHGFVWDRHRHGRGAHRQGQGRAGSRRRRARLER
jgi:CBS domain containing-hemolysin-like protein